jgi:hypothetical protein
MAFAATWSQSGISRKGIRRSLNGRLNLALLLSAQAPRFGLRQAIEGGSRILRKKTTLSS